MWWTDWNHDRWGIKAVKFAWLFNPLSSSSSIIILTVATPHVNPCMSVSVAVKNNFLCLIINHLHQLQIPLALFTRSQIACVRWSKVMLETVTNLELGTNSGTSVRVEKKRESYPKELWELVKHFLGDDISPYLASLTKQWNSRVCLPATIFKIDNWQKAVVGQDVCYLCMEASWWYFKLWKPLWIQQL